ncbi:hypothetical protein V8F20_001789 [Naviculisporaceae sp. PSN 640]
MKVWPIDPLVPRNLRLEVPEKLPQGLTIISPRRNRGRTVVAVGGSDAAWAKHLDAGNSRRPGHTHPYGVQGLGGSTLAKVLVGGFRAPCLRYGLLPPERVLRLPAAWPRSAEQAPETALRVPRGGITPASRHSSSCRCYAATQPGSGKAKGAPAPMLIPRGALGERSPSGPRRARKGVGGARQQPRPLKGRASPTRKRARPSRACSPERSGGV